MTLAHIDPLIIGVNGLNFKRIRPQLLTLDEFVNFCLLFIVYFVPQFAKQLLS